MYLRFRCLLVMKITENKYSFAGYFGLFSEYLCSSYESGVGEIANLFRVLLLGVCRLHWAAFVKSAIEGVVLQFY